MNALVEMCNPTHSSSALQQLFYVSLESHAQSLSSLGQPQESYGPLFVPIILNKLPADIKRTWQDSTVVIIGPLTSYQMPYLQKLGF